MERKSSWPLVPHSGRRGSVSLNFPFPLYFGLVRRTVFLSFGRSVGPHPQLSSSLFSGLLSPAARAHWRGGGVSLLLLRREGGRSLSQSREGRGKGSARRKKDQQGRKEGRATFSRARCSDAATTACYNGKRRVQILRFSFFGGVSQKKGPSHRLFRSLVVSQRAFDLPVAMLSE